MEDFEKKLKSHLSDVIQDLEKNITPLIYNHLFKFAIKRSYYSLKNGDGFEMVQDQVVVEDMMRMAITDTISSYDSTTTLCNFVAASGRWFNNAQLGSTQGRFDIVNTLPAAFITRMFVVSSHKLIFTDEAFEIAFSELKSFLSKNIVEYEVYIHLSGVIGSGTSIDIDDFASIAQLDENTAKEFTIRYGEDHFTSQYQLSTNNYALILKFSYPKSEFSDHKRYFPHSNKRYRDYIAKWRLICYLSLGGNFSFGNNITRSKDWPIFPDLPYIGSDYKNNFVPDKKVNNLDLSIDRIKQVHSQLFTISLEKVTPLLSTSIERLVKSKLSVSISDRLLELAIAYETMIANSKQEVVGLQLKIKLINLIFEENILEKPFKDLTDFYNLRSDIVHGNKLVENKETNLTILNNAEKLIQNGIIRLMVLLQTFPHKKINDALRLSMFIRKPLSKILEEIIEPKASNDALPNI